MALSDMLVGSALQSSREAPDLQGAITKGVELGQVIESARLKRQQLEQMKRDAQLQKFEKVGGWIETASKMPDGAAKKAFVNNFVPNGIKALGLSDQIDPTAFEMIKGDPNLGSFLVSEIRNGKLDLGVLSSPEGIARLAASPEYAQFGGTEALKSAVDEYRPKVEEAFKDRKQQEATQTNAEIAAQAAMGRQIQDQMSAGDVELRKQTAKKLSAASPANVSKSVDAINEAIAELRAGTVKFGTIGKNIPFGSDENVLARLDPKAKALVDKVRGAINVRAALADPNPTEKQINAIMSRAIDPRLDKEENIKKLEAMSKELIGAYNDTNEEARMMGLPTKRSLDTKGTIPKDKIEGFKKLKPENRERALSKFAEFYNLPMDEVRRQLGVK